MISDGETPRDRGRRLRAQSTDKERKLWRHLRAKRFAEFKFRRQHRLGAYFADFCCIEQHLIIELDGSQHAEPEESRDGLRTACLNQQGYRVLRFCNEQVNSELESVLAKLLMQP